MNELKFQFSSNPDNAPAMEGYMRNKFVFLGLKSPERRLQTKKLFELTKESSLGDIHQYVEQLYERDAREYQYAALDLIEHNLKSWQLADMFQFMKLIRKKSWWDTVDHLAAILGRYLKRNPEDKVEIFIRLYKSTNMWERRVSIILQLKEKENTDTCMLEKVLIFDRLTDEFFIQKAIGWALREYSKSNPAWVVQFLNDHQLSGLAAREASKYL